MAKYKFFKDGIEFEIDFIIQQNFISIQGRTNINSLTYSLNLSLKDLQNKDPLFQRCNSLEEACDLFIKYFNNKKGFIKEINNYEIILEILKQYNEDILFSLIKNPINNINQNPPSINNYDESRIPSNPMVMANKNIHFNYVAE